MTIGRNGPCPCGSGKKFKKCCLAATSPAEPPTRATPRFRFEAGSYGGPHRQFLPSAICHEQIAPGKWRDYFCLVKLEQSYGTADEASAQAAADLSEAASHRSDLEPDIDFAMMLKHMGYIKVEPFQRAEFSGIAE